MHQPLGRRSKIESFTIGATTLYQEWIAKQYVEFQKTQNLGAIDWISQLDPNCHVIYSCVNCKKAPITNNLWFRTTGSVKSLNTPDMYSAKNGCWTCAICLWKHHAADRDYMLFAIGDEERHFLAFMGNKSPETENKLNLLKTFSLLKKIGDKDVTTSVILDAIQQLQEEAAVKFGCFALVSKYSALDPNKLSNNHGYAEHPNLSLMKAGGVIDAFDVSRIDIPTMSQNLIEYVIQLCFACMDMGTTPVPS